MTKPNLTDSPQVALLKLFFHKSKISEQTKPNIFLIKVALLVCITIDGGEFAVDKIEKHVETHN